ncbi:Alpha/Beta hydrolase protein [Microdochium bolleyi]|uniref:Alpha/Beta hydrolase protein n=1 Tax=Microdochium bolleyi TaxID=196109 RepID=A0A136IS51_9PEZI|nr:Alpha/Beta hydrolase protein [Microdochium bolleyi]
MRATLLLLAGCGLAAASSGSRGRRVETFNLHGPQPEDIATNGGALPRLQRRGDPLIPQNANTTKFAVDGTALPEVPFDIGESYAGLLPISNNETDRSLFFWYFPTADPLGKDELTIWLSGGPGCSSMAAAAQGHGPFLWQAGTRRPVRNPLSWHGLTNMIYVDQPVGTGYSTGAPRAKTEEQIAAEFMGFWRNFVDTFGLHGKKVYIAGASWAGFYVPYLASAMLDAQYFNVRGTFVYNAIIGASDTQGPGEVLSHVERWAGLYNLNATTLARVRALHEACGYGAYRDAYFRYPPPDVDFPFNDAAWEAPCLEEDVWTLVYDAAALVNPCFNEYDISARCPRLWNVLADTEPGNDPEKHVAYFDRADVKRALHAAPGRTWAQCNSGVYRERNAPSSLTVLPGVVDRSDRTVVAHGNLDLGIIDSGTRFALQNMTWGGRRGFQAEPGTAFFVPYELAARSGGSAGAGEMGITHTERGLTWVEVFRAGHSLPQFAPAAAYRQLQFLLGRVDSLTE